MSNGIFDIDLEIKLKLRDMMEALLYDWNKNSENGKSNGITNGKLTRRQFNFLEAIKKKTDGSPSLNLVAKALGTTRQNARQIAVSLQKRGFLKIEKDKKDARSLKLVLNDMDNGFWQKAETGFANQLNSNFNSINSNELYELFDIVSKAFQLQISSHLLL